MKKIFVCHEFYTPSHYTALVYLAHENGYEVVFCEPNLFRQFRQSVKNRIPRSRLLHNIITTTQLLLSHGHKVVIGMAPYNPFLKILLFVLHGHELYYHSSYCCWDGTKFAHKGSEYDKALWKDFTNNLIKHFFAVSQKTKDEVIKNGFSEANNITVVNHSYDINIVGNTSSPKSNDFVCVGRLCNQKGTMQLLEIFARHPEANISFVGNGEYEDKVKSYARLYPNIKYLGYVIGLDNLVPIYKNHSFVIMNSIRTESWEELFGMALVEGMACGCVPLCNDHPGPKEIVEDNNNGFLCKEGDIEKLITKAIAMDNQTYQKLKINAINIGKHYHCSIISKHWMPILSE